MLRASWLFWVVLAVLLASGVVQGGYAADPLGFAAAVALALLLGAVAWRRGWPKEWADPQALRWAAIATFGVLSVGLIMDQRLALLDGGWVAWAEDDAMVSMQYGRNLAEGQGLVWSVGERVEGFSNPLWTLAMAGACALLPRDLAPIIPLLLSVGLGIVAILATGRLARALGAGPLPAGLAMLGLGLSYEAVYAALSGLETLGLAALAAVAWADLAEARREGRPAGWRPFALAGAMGVLRFDGLLPAVLVVGLAWSSLDAARRRLALALALGPALAWAAFRFAYYGEWVPNTVRLKGGAWPGRWEKGLFYILRTGYHAGLAWALGLLAWLDARLRPWAAALAVLLAYGGATGGDIYPGTRYLAAAWPLLWALPAAALSLRWPRAAAPATALAALLSYTALWAFPGLMHSAWREARDRVAVARTLDGLAAPGDRVAVAWAGSFLYYSSLRGVDLLGKCDPVVARAPADPAVPIVGHNRLDLAHSLGVLRPEWVLSIPPGLPDEIKWLHTSYELKLWTHPLLREHCRPHPQALDGPWVLLRCHWP